MRKAKQVKHYSFSDGRNYYASIDGYYLIHPDSEHIILESGAIVVLERVPNYDFTRLRGQGIHAPLIITEEDNE